MNCWSSNLDEVLDLFNQPDQFDKYHLVIDINSEDQVDEIYQV